MDDAISRSAVLEEARSLESLESLSHYANVYVVDVDDIKALPALDVVPVVRCKDCENTDPSVGLPEGMFYCNEWESTTRGHWYCCRGEKKEED